MEERLFQRFARLAYDKAGISIRPGKEALVTARVAKRQRALSIPDPESYLRLLEADPSGEELLLFLDAISTHFTSFFREPDHFEALDAELRHLVDRGQTRLRLWSAACSTGEEPWSMAMTALSVPGVAAADLKILATDIAEETLRQAEAGAYPASRLSPVPQALFKRWFQRTGESPGPEGQVFGVVPELRRRVVFRRLNLTEPPYPMKGPFDAIFCRNVLIYFDQATRQRLIGGMERLLGPGGLLCIGHTETLSGIRCGLKMVRPSVFRKPSGEGA